MKVLKNYQMSAKKLQTISYFLLNLTNNSDWIMAAPPYGLQCFKCEYLNGDEPCFLGMTCPKCKKGSMETR